MDYDAEIDAILGSVLARQDFTSVNPTPTLKPSAEGNSSSLAASHLTSALVSPIVKSLLPSVSPTHQPTQTTAIPNVRREATPAEGGNDLLMASIKTAASTYTKVRAPSIRASRQFKTTLTTKSAAKIKRTTQPTWLLSQDIDKVHCFHNVLAAAANDGAHHMTLNLNLDYTTERRILADANPTGMMHRVLHRHLRGLDARFYAFLEVCEVTDATEQARRLAKGLPEFERLHLHGEIGFPQGTLARVTSALVKAGGSMKDAKGNPVKAQLAMKPCPNSHWRFYAAKGASRYSVTADLLKEARDHYDRWREHDRITLAKRAALNRIMKATKRSFTETCSK